MRRVNPLTGKVEVVPDVVDPFEQARRNKEQFEERPYSDPFVEARERRELEWERKTRPVRIRSLKRRGPKDSFSKTERKRAAKKLGVGYKRKKKPLFDSALESLRQRAGVPAARKPSKVRPLRVRSVKQAEKEARLEAEFESKFYVNKDGRIRYKSELPPKPEKTGWFKKLRQIGKKKTEYNPESGAFKSRPGESIYEED